MIGGMANNYYKQLIYNIYIMASNGEIYHLAFNLHDELMKKGIQVTTVEMRDYLKELNGQGMSLADMEKKAREAAMEIHNKKINALKTLG
jgi:hypothetical protein